MSKNVKIRGPPYRDSLQYKLILITMAQPYNFKDSLDRLERKLSAPIPENASESIPKNIDESNTKIYLTNATIMCVSYEESQSFLRHNIKGSENLSINGFVSESIAIGRANENCRDIVVYGNKILFVYSTPLKKDLERVIDDAARIRTLGFIVSKIASGKNVSGLEVNIGINYGSVSLIPVEIISECRQYVWKGKTFENAVSLMEDAQGKILISPVVFDNLNEKTRELFERDLGGESYSGSIVNVMMNNWLRSE